jgi:hypothetical protein
MADVVGYHATMGRGLVFAALLASACDARLGEPATQHDQPDASGPRADSSSANQPDAPLGMWGAATAINGADDPTLNIDDCTLNSTETELYFKHPNGAGDDDLYVMTRMTATDPWGTPAAVTALDSGNDEESPRLSPDDLAIYFGRDGNIFKSTRGMVGGTWGPPAAVNEINTGTYNKWLAVCDNDYFMVSRAVSRGMTSDQDLFVGHLDGVDPGTLAATISATGYNEISAFLSKDCTTTYFASNRSGQTQIYTATRATATDPFGAPALVSDFGTATDNEDLWVSTDQRLAVFASVRGTDTKKALYQSTR